jgi:hypothetical protein
VQRISIGALTHSAPAADIALELTLGQGGRRPTRSEPKASEGGPLHGGVGK